MARYENIDYSYDVCNLTLVHLHYRPMSLVRDHEAILERDLQGRKILEHEFGKAMRFRAIRDLVDGDSGLVVQDLKPIWLMSPLSVSDTLPLHTQFVDVVIFNEASQVRLEESIPTLFHSTQTIIVGDTMQLPPTNFFSHGTAVEDLKSNGDATDASSPAFDLSSDSLLSHSIPQANSNRSSPH